MFIGLTRLVEKAEIEMSIKLMKRNKAVGTYNIPIEAWMALGNEGIDSLWDQMSKVENQ